MNSKILYLLSLIVRVFKSRLHTCFFSCVAYSLFLGVTPGYAQIEMRLANNPTLSSNGLRLAVDWAGDIWVGSSFGGRMQRLTSSTARDTRPVFSPDGRHIAFVSDRNGNKQVYRVPVEGGTPKQLTVHSKGAEIEDWSPDGKQLLITAKRDHWWTNTSRQLLISSEHKSTESLVFDAESRNGKFSSCGTKLLFTREGVAWWRTGYRGSDASQVWLYDTAADTFERLSKPGAEARWPLWLTSADSDSRATEDSRQSVLFTSNARGPFNLWLRKPDGTETQITHYEKESVVSPCVSRDEQIVVFRKQFHLYRLDLNSDEPPQRIGLSCQDDVVHPTSVRRILRKASEVTFSSDGLEIAMISGGDLWVMDTVLREPHQVTNTAAAEHSPQFSPDDQTLAYISEASNQPDIWIANRKEEDKYWWQNVAFDLESITQDEHTESNLQWSPDGKHLAFVRGRQKLCAINLESRDITQIASGATPPDYDWSPDGNWLCYSTRDNFYNSDVYIAPVDCSFTPINISQHPKNDFGPRWSPDGSMIAFTGFRENNTRDIFIANLDKPKQQNWRRESKLQAAIETMQEAREQKQATSEPLLAAINEEALASVEGADASSPIGDSLLRPSATHKVEWQEYLERIEIPDSHEYRLVWSPDSRKIIYSARSQNQQDTYCLTLDDTRSRKLVTHLTGRNARWIKRNDVIAWQSNGVPGSMSLKGKSLQYTFAAYQRLSQTEYYGAVFDECWRTMRDRFYDANLNQLDWDEIRNQHVSAARESIDKPMLADVIRMMLGTLNASHMGFTVKPPKQTLDDKWSEKTVHLGVSFEPTEDKESLRITNVIKGSPADAAHSKLYVDDEIVSINGKLVRDTNCPTELLNQPNYQPVVLVVRNKEGVERTFPLTPISSSKTQDLLYNEWVNSNKQKVYDLSDGKFAYLHVRSMTKDYLYQFERELFGATSARKAGLIVDVRNNRGGNIADHLIAMLNPDTHATTFRRKNSPGYPQYRKPYITWDKPLVVLCNQNSFSNAEIFCHAIKSLNRGVLVGTTTGGGVISTNAIRISDIGKLRVPHRGWRVAATGKNMEEEGAVPNVVVELSPGKLIVGEDRQLLTALKELLSLTSSTLNLMQ